MLWNVLWRNKNSFSLTFTIGFSILGILWQTNPFSRGVGFLGNLADRISGALNTSLELPGSIWVEIDKYRELEKRYEAAQKMLEDYRLEKDKFDYLKAENARLLKAMDFPPDREYPELKGRILAIRINSISPRIIINRGRKDGVEPFMPVITRAYDQDQNLIRAVVGIVASVDNSTAIIQPINHPGFRLGVRIPATDQWAILSGNSGNLTEVLLTYVANDPSPGAITHSDTNVPIPIGSSIYTSGEGGIFPAGIPVGRLIREGRRKGEFKTAFVETYASIGSLDFITVILKKPDNWAKSMEKKIDWDQNLLTEFGPPVYPESLRTAKPAHQARPSKPAAEAKPAQEEPSQNEARENRQTQNGNEPPGPRVIQNVVIPGDQ